MSRRGNCYDNSVVEAFFSSLKSELVERFDTCGDAKMELFDYIEVFYNQRRRHSTIGYLSPAAFERQARMICVPAFTGGRSAASSVQQSMLTGTPPSACMAFYDR